jgi:two-component system chemotaxis sensor kinase CheA
MARDPYKYFRIESRELMDQLSHGLLELDRQGGGSEVVARLLRLAHTLKGAARVVRLPGIADHAHAIETLLEPFREAGGSVSRDAIEVLLARVDQIAGAVNAIAAPVSEAVASQPSATPRDEPSWGFTSEVGEIDQLLAGVSESYAQLDALRGVSVLAGRASRLAAEMAEAAGPAVRDGGPERSVGELSVVAADLERGILQVHRRVEREIRQLREAVEQLRLVPMRLLFPFLERAAWDSARALGKEISFVGSGGDIRLDGAVGRVVQDALLQLVRNAVAHGIEDRQSRELAGKPALGRIGVAVLRRGTHIVLRCEDDGQGVNLPALLEAAARRGRTGFDPDRLDSTGLARLLLEGGASTSRTVSEVAGRGIGMDIVRDAVTRLGAQFAVSTKAGNGTVFELIVPQSVSSVEAVVVESASLRAAIPLYAIKRTLRLEPAAVCHTPLGPTIVHEAEAIPLLPLLRLLGRPAPAPHGRSFAAVVIAAESGLAAVSVEHIGNTASLVFRPLPDLAPVTPVVAGASLDADGRPLLMLEPNGIVGIAQRGGEPEPQVIAARPKLLVIDDSLTTRMLEQSILETAGYDVDLAISGEEGLERARNGDYALILVDVEMPGMDGFTFIEQIRRDSRLRTTPAILVTSRNMPEDKQRGREVGAQDYVVKGEFDEARLLDRIRQLVMSANG